MAELPIRDNYLNPISIELYDASGDAVILMDWKGCVQKVKASFYWKQMELLQVVNPFLLSTVTRTPNPDTSLQDFKAMAYHDIGFFGDIMMESAPPVSVVSYYRVIAALYSKGTKIDPYEPCPPCPPGGGTATSCQPLADLEIAAAPIATLEMDAAPVAGLDQDDAPVASLECKILS